MNFLVISPSVPAKDAKGFQVLAYERLRHLALSKNNKIALVCFGKGATDEARKSVLVGMGIRVFMIPWLWREAGWSLLKAIWDRKMPLQCALFRSSAFDNAIQLVIQSDSIDAIYSVTIRVLPNIKGNSTPLILDLVDSMGLNFRRRTERAAWYMRPLWRFEQRRVAQFEREAAIRSVASFVVSSIDQMEINAPNLHILPLGIDLTFYAQPYPAPVAPVIVLTGNMSYRPNVEAAIWMAERCWPSIIAAAPESRLVIAGNAPARSVLELAKIRGVQVTGAVPSMAAVIQTAQIAVAPMQSGSGMQFKILEAMACGIPVVTTPIGLGDIKAQPQKQIIIGKTPEEFVCAVMTLLRSDSLRHQVGTSGRNFVFENHSSLKISINFENIIYRSLTIE